MEKFVADEIAVHAVRRIRKRPIDDAGGDAISTQQLPDRACAHRIGGAFLLFDQSETHQRLRETEVRQQIQRLIRSGNHIPACRVHARLVRQLPGCDRGPYGAGCVGRSVARCITAPPSRRRPKFGNLATRPYSVAMTSSDAPSRRIMHTRELECAGTSCTATGVRGGGVGSPAPRRYSGPASEATSTNPNTAATICRPRRNRSLHQREAHAQRPRTTTRRVRRWSCVPPRRGPIPYRKPSRFSQVTTAIMQTAIVPKAARSRRLIHPGGLHLAREQLTQHDQAVEKCRGMDAVERGPRQR